MNRTRLSLAVIGICLIAAVSQAQTTTPASGPRGGARPGTPSNALDVLAPLAGSQTAQGRVAPVGNSQNAWWTDTALMTRLGLTDTQKLRIESSFQAYRLILTSAKDTLEREEAQLSRLLDVDSVDRSTVMLQVNKVIQARSEMERVNAAMTVEMREQLTRSQWAQLQAGARGGGGRGSTPAGGTPAPDSFAARFAADKPVTLDGKVTDFKFQDPHVLIVIDVVGSDGKISSWTGEMGSATTLGSRMGWTSSTLKPGERVVMEGSHSLDPNENLINIRSIRRVP